MKIILAKATIAAVAAHGADICTVVAGECNIHPELLAGELPGFEAKHQRMHYSDTFECYQYEIDDVVLLRIVSLAARITRTLMPIIGLAKSLLPAMFKHMDREFTEIEKMLTAPADDDGNGLSKMIRTPRSKHEGGGRTAKVPMPEDPDTEQYMAAYDAMQRHDH